MIASSGSDAKGQTGMRMRSKLVNCAGRTDSRIRSVSQILHVYTLIYGLSGCLALNQLNSI